MLPRRIFCGILTVLVGIFSLDCTILLAAEKATTTTPSPTSLGRAVRIACVGDSITEGAGVADPAVRGWPARLQGYLGEKSLYEVRNFGVSARTLQKAGDHPYWNEKAFANAKDFQPDIVLIKLGTNDSKPQNWNPKRFTDDAIDMIRTFQQLPTRPRVVVCLPIPVFQADQWGIRETVVANEVIPALRKAAFETGSDLLDFYHPYLGRGAMVPDTVHPNAYGADELAKLAYRHLTVPVDSAFDIAKKLPSDAKRSDWFGYECFEFSMEGRRAKVIKPKYPNARHSWAWRAEFFGHEPQADLALLENGFHLVFIDTFGLNGSPQAMDIWEKFYDLLVAAGLEKRSTMIGMSRGGLYSYNWAVRHPDRVIGIYGDNPVMDICSWPGGMGKGKGHAPTWKELLSQYQLTEANVKAWKGGPLDHLKPLVEAKIALFHLVGDADDVVPAEENTGVLEKRLREWGGKITVIHKPGLGHHPHSLPNPEPITEFILRANDQWVNFSAIPAASQEWRNGSAGWGKQSWKDQLENIRKAAQEGPYEIALLGDSITQGWTNSTNRRFQLGGHAAVNMGISGDRTQNLLWRIEHGMLDGPNQPKCVVVMIGINNLYNGESAEDTAEGARRVLAEIEKRVPGVPVLFYACFPGGKEPQGTLRRAVNRYHELVTAEGFPKPVRYIDLREGFVNAEGSLHAERMNGDAIHISPAGRQFWTENILKNLP